MNRTVVLAGAFVLGVAALAAAQPRPAAPERQAPVPEVGAAHDGAHGSQPPDSAELDHAPSRPSDTGAPPMSVPLRPGPAEPNIGQPGVIAQPAGSGPGSGPAYIPFGDHGQPSAETEETRAARDGGRIHGWVTIPDRKSANLIQPEGHDWRQVHSVWLPWAGAAIQAGALASIGLFFLWRGRIRIRNGWSGRTLPRFNALERANHWMVASCFIVLALTGLNLTFGRWLLLPWIGPEAFTALSTAGKLAHNFLGFPFTLGILVMFALWVRGNIPDRGDITWLRQGGGMVGDRHPPAARFNAGQKAVFWMTVLGGGAVAVSGFLLIFPFTVTEIRGQQWAQIVHALLAMLLIAGILGHIYIGTLGMEGAASAMTTGRVDLNWAREHHALWAQQQMDGVQPAADARTPPAAGRASAA
jgi:formate dehydrogenase subunit gamma